jgi:long-chain acyl-CoA synthetase
VRIADDHELLVRGPNFMQGHWNPPEDTARIFLDGWLRTGDQAAIEATRIRIIGRSRK